MTFEFGDLSARRFDSRQAAETYYRRCVCWGDTWLIVLPATDPAADPVNGSRRRR